VEKPRKPFTRSATKKLIPADETFRCHETEDVVEDKPPPGKKVMFSVEVLDKEKLGRPVTRSSVRRQIHVEETRPKMHVQCVVEEVVEVQFPSEKKYMAVKRLKRQLKEAQDEIVMGVIYALKTH